MHQIYQRYQGTICIFSHVRALLFRSVNLPYTMNCVLTKQDDVDFLHVPGKAEPRSETIRRATSRARSKNDGSPATASDQERRDTAPHSASSGARLNGRASRIGNRKSSSRRPFTHQVTHGAERPTASGHNR